MNNIIEARQVRRAFDSGEVSQEVLKGIDLQIKEGEFVAITGRSGAGKSTLLYQLSALDRPTTGTVFIAGKNTSQMSEEQLTDFRLHTLGYIFQDYALIPDLTALENVITPLLMRGMSWTEAEQVAFNALQAVGLEGRIANAPAQLSGGEQQRVSIARAIAGQPKILFADEPTANLDSHSGRTVIDLLVSLHRSLHQTIVMVTHEMEYTYQCDRVIQLEDGKLVSTGSGDTRDRY